MRKAMMDNANPPMAIASTRKVGLVNAKLIGRGNSTNEIEANVTIAVARTSREAA